MLVAYLGEIAGGVCAVKRSTHRISGMDIIKGADGTYGRPVVVISAAGVPALLKLAGVKRSRRYCALEVHAACELAL